MNKPHELDRLLGYEEVQGNRESMRLLFQMHLPLEVPLSSWGDCGLSAGMEVSPELMSQLEADAAFGHARRRAVRYLSIQPRTEHEIRGYLRRCGIESAITERILNDLSQRGLVNDLQYAEMFVASKGSVMSGRELRWRLKKRGLTKNTVVRALSERDEQADLLAAQTMAAKYWRSHLSVPEDKRIQRLGGYLQRRGYSTAIVFDVLRQYSSHDEHS